MGKISGHIPADLIARERRVYERRPKAELLRVVRALEIHAWQNSIDENARLIAARQLLGKR